MHKKTSKSDDLKLETKFTDMGNGMYKIINYAFVKDGKIEHVETRFFKEI